MGNPTEKSGGRSRNLICMVYFKDERVKQALLFLNFVAIFVFEKWALAIFNLGFW